MMERNRAVDGVLVALNGFTALTAIGGGIALMTGAEGERFPAKLLEGTPFGSYAIPGLILAGAVGGTATVATVATLRNPRAGARASVPAGLALMGWIVGEVLILPRAARSWWEAVYFAVGLAMTTLGLRGSGVIACAQCPCGEKGGIPW